MHGFIDKTRLALAAMVAITLVFPPGSPVVPAASAYAAPVTQNVSAEIVQPAPAVRAGDAIAIAVTVSISAPAEYLEVRLRLRTPEGRLIFQKTEIRSEVAEGRHTVEFERSAENPVLTQGRYPVEVRVLATGSDPTNVSGRVLVLDPAAPRQQVAVVARTWAMPLVGRDGRFSVDPAGESGLRRDLTAVASIASEQRAPVALIVAPVLIEELGRAAEGYQTADGQQVLPNAETPADAAATLAALTAARDNGLLTVLDAPYALPDHAGLAAIGAGTDLDAQWARTDSVMLAALRSKTTSQSAYLGETLTDTAVATLARREAPGLLAPSAALEDIEGEPVTGVHPLDGSGTVAIVPDDDASAAIEIGPAEFYDVMFDRIGPDPIVLLVEIGPGSRGSATGVQRALDLIDRSGWLDLTSIDDLAPAGDAVPVRLRSDIESTAPAAHWRTVGEARASLLAYREATGPDDPDVESLSRALLVAESGLWAGANGAWGGALRAREMAEDVTGFVTSEFEKITIDAKDVTLSGSAGDVPFTLVNNTGKHLALTIVATFSDGGAEGIVQRVEVDPMENFITAPVDLRNSMASDLEVTVRSGDIVVARTDVTVRASYIDRLGTVGLVVLVLLVLLLVIRRRIGRPNAATIDGEKSPVSEQ